MLVPDWKEAYTWYSEHGAALLTTFSAAQVLSEKMQAMVPWPVFASITAFLGVLIAVGRVLQQGGEAESVPK